MGRNKRDSSSVDDLNDSSDTQSEEIVSKPLKKLKREKRGGVEADVVNEEVGVKQLKKTKGVREKGVEDDEPEEEDGVSKPSKKSKKEKRDNGMENEVNPSVEEENMNPMERRKKRKTSDKLKHQTRLKSGDAPKVLKSVEGVSTNVPQLHLDVFKDLASSDSSIREAAAEALVTQLGSVQEAYEKVDKSGDEGGISPLEAEKDDGLKNCAPSLSYAIRRLIRGVSSSRECARQGFALGLTVVVSSIPCVNVDSLMKLITDLLEVSSSMKGQEVRECLLGRLFAYGALARSGKVADEWKSDKKTSCVKEFTSTIISLAAKKRYLQEPAVSVILDLVEKLPLEALLSQVFEAPGLQEWFHGALESGNPDALLLALKMREKVSTDNLVFGKLLPCPFSPNRLLTADHLSCLIPCFKESTFCQPRVHGVWAALINIILPSTTLQEEDATLGPSSTKKHKKNRKTNSSEEDIGKNVRSFCEIVVEGSLLVSSHDRKHLAFDILLLLLPRLPTSCVQIILSHKLVHCLMDILSTKDSWLFKAAEYFLKEITDWVRNDDERRVAVIVALQKHSSGRFDCITRTKTVKGLVGELNTGSGCMLFVQNLVSMFVDEEPEMDEPSDQSQTTDDNSELGVTNDKDLAGMESNPDFLKSWIINSLPCILKDVKLVPEAKILVQKEIMKFLAIQGLFSASLGTEVTSFDLKETFKWPKVATSSSLCQMCIEQLQLLIANAQKEKSVAVNSEKVEISPSFENNRDMNDLGSYFMHFIGAVCNIPSVSLFRRLSGEDDKAFKKLQAMEARLSAEETNMGPGTDANKMHALRYLMIQLLLQLILRPGEFHKATFELIICCTKAFPSCDILDSPDEDNVLDAGDAPTMVDVLVDTLLSLLPQSYPPVRSAVEQVFKFFCNDITDAGLISILKIVKSDLKPARHQTTDSEDDSDDDEDFLDINETEETDEGETINTAEDSNDEENESEITTRIDSSDEKLPEGSDDSDGGMDDDAMFRMDSYLARIFLEKKSQAAVGESPQSQLVLFKLRALSLLEIYLHENPGK
ncbi:hypothetical protein GIB67_003254 [Kingdonia uniflora]|uniref:DNA polymerase V n=1 Tax=Kingdonia uniflora TaxID=39325 RepID=A0A7J7LXH3_9MAGN|nr:hypothetical protein GIB67_003254 [Kingdonia uniflora]